MKKIALLGFISLFLAFGMATKATPKISSATPDYLYTQDFENYDGTTATDSYVWNSCGLVCDAASKSMINSGENINGYSLKAGGTGYCYSNHLIAFKNDAANFSSKGSGYYTTEFDVIINNADNFGFSWLEPYTDKYYGGLSFNPNSVNTTINCSTSVAFIEEVGNHLHVTFDFKYESGASWGYFFANFTTTGYIVVDNIKVSVSENDHSGSTDPDFTGYKYYQTFESYAGQDDVRYFLWNNLHWVSDAETTAFINTFTDPDAINKTSLKVGQSNSGYYGSNLVFCSRGGDMNPFDTGEGKWTIEFDVKLNNIVEFNYYLKVVDVNAIITKITFNPNDIANATATNQFFSVTKNEDVYHVVVDAVTEDSNNWSEFGLVFGDGGGYMVIDNIAIKESTNDYNAAQVIFIDNFESYNGESDIGLWLWGNTHFYSGSTYISIEEGFDGKALWSKTPQGTYAGEGYFGLQGSNGPNAIYLAKDTMYEMAFDIATVNVNSFDYFVKYLDPDRGDVDFVNVNINPVKKTFSCNEAISINFGVEYTHVCIQFKAPFSGLYFGYFSYSCDNNGQVAFDNYKLTRIIDYSIPLFQSGFESCETNPFTIETNKFKKEEMLGRITNDYDLVINGSYSALCGFDATDIFTDSEKWGALLKASRTFDADHSYTIQFRFKIISPSEHFFYLELGGPTGLYIRFDDSGIIENNAGVSGSVTNCGDYYLLKTQFDITGEPLNNLLVGTYGGGFIVIDDMSIYQGVYYPELPEIVKYQPSGTKLIEEGFEGQNFGKYLKGMSYISGVDVFGYRMGYNDEAINGAVSAVIYAGGEWGEEIQTANNLLDENTIYTVCFRYKPLSLATGNLTFIVRGDTEKYIALGLDGKVKAFTYSGGAFYKDISLASVTKRNDYYEASITFCTPFGSPKAIIGTYGVVEVAIDDFTIYRGNHAEFSSAVSKIATADRSELSAYVTECSRVDTSIYTDDTVQAFRNEINAAKALISDLSATQAQIDEAYSKLQTARNNLFEKVAADFISSVTQIEALTDREEKYHAIAQALSLYKRINDKGRVSESYEKLVAIVEQYNNEVNELNSASNFSGETVLEAVSLVSLIAVFFWKGKKFLWL